MFSSDFWVIFWESERTGTRASLVGGTGRQSPRADLLVAGHGALPRGPSHLSSYPIRNNNQLYSHLRSRPHLKPGFFLRPAGQPSPWPVDTEHIQPRCVQLALVMSLLVAFSSGADAGMGSCGRRGRRLALSSGSLLGCFHAVLPPSPACGSAPSCGHCGGRAALLAAPFAVAACLVAFTVLVDVADATLNHPGRVPLVASMPWVPRLFLVFWVAVLGMLLSPRNSAVLEQAFRFTAGILVLMREFSVLASRCPCAQMGLPGGCTRARA